MIAGAVRAAGVRNRFGRLAFSSVPLHREVRVCHNDGMSEKERAELVAELKAAEGRITDRQRTDYAPTALKKSTIPTSGGVQ